MTKASYKKTKRAKFPFHTLARFQATYSTQPLMILAISYEDTNRNLNKSSFQAYHMLSEILIPIIAYFFSSFCIIFSFLFPFLCSSSFLFFHYCSMFFLFVVHSISLFFTCFSMNFLFLYMFYSFFLYFLLLLILLSCFLFVLFVSFHL